MKNPHTPQQLYAASPHHVELLAAKLRWFIRIVSILLVIFFTWLQIRDVEIASIIERTSPQILLRIALIAYYFCWVFGTTFDLNLMQSVLTKVPDRGRLTWGAVGVLLAFAITTFALLWASDDEKHFAYLLCAFWIVGTGSFWYLQCKIKPMFSESSAISKQRSIFDHERLLTVQNFMLGEWQWTRNAISFVLILIVTSVTLLDYPRHVLDMIGVQALPQAHRALVEALLPTLSFLFFIVVTEGWIWLERFRVGVTLHVLDDLATRYTLVQTTLPETALQ